jgi:hypothetical protein
VATILFVALFAKQDRFAASQSYVITGFVCRVGEGFSIMSELQKVI